MADVPTSAETEIPAESDAVVADAVSGVAVPTDGPVTETPATEPAAMAAPAAVAAEPEGPIKRPNPRKVREGIVSSSTMDKTVVVKVVERVRHPRYAKTLQHTTKLYVDDPGNTATRGDRVRIAETRPTSKLKRWRLVEILERAK
jgi:small subunit ribosomal protein S17